MNWRSIVGKNQAAQALQGNSDAQLANPEGTFIQMLITSYPQTIWVTCARLLATVAAVPQTFIMWLIMASKPQ